MEDIAGAGGAPLPLAYCAKEMMPALLMSFCGRDTLKQHLVRGASCGGFSLEHVLSLALRVTERLQDLHRAGFVHCDLKANNVTLRLDAERNVESVHIIDFGLSARVWKRREPRQRPRNKPWCCDCRYNGSPLLPECDLPGLGMILRSLFRDRDDVPRRLADLAERCSSPSHRGRPALETVRRCLAAAPSAKRPREDKDEDEDEDEAAGVAEGTLAQAPESKRARGDAEQGARILAH